MPQPPSFTLGIEEEFQVIEPYTRELKSHIQEMFAEGEKRLKDEIKREMHDAVIEVGTPICRDVAHARKEVTRLRGEICRLAGHETDARRFRPNILVSLEQAGPFVEDAWLGGVLAFGDADDAPAIAVTMRDVRCSMVNLDPDSAQSSADVLKAAVRTNANNAGIYGTVIRTGRLEAGQSIYLRG